MTNWTEKVQGAQQAQSIDYGAAADACFAAHAQGLDNQQTAAMAYDAAGVQPLQQGMGRG